MRWLLFSLLLGIAQAATAQSDSYPSGLDLVSRCNAVTNPGGVDASDPETLGDYGYCIGFIVGYVSGFATRDAGGAAAAFCPPDDATIADFVAAIHEWLAEHPEGLEQLGAYVAGQAFRRRFACAGK